MSVVRMRRFLVVAGSAAVALTTVAVPAGAATGGSHPAPLCAAYNMTIAISPDDPTWGSAFGYQYAVSDGMGQAMTVNNANGNNGMVTAVMAGFAHAQSPSCQ